MTITPRFGNVDSPAIASYDWVDIATGTGYIIYYGATTEDSDGTDEIMTDDSDIYSRSIDTNYAIQHGDKFTDGAAVDKDFDLTAFTNPYTVKGTAIIQNGIYVTGRASETASAYITYNFFKVSGGVETNIGTKTTIQWDKSADAKTYYTTHIRVPMTHTSFAQDDLLRVNVQVFASGTGTGTTGDVAFGHDPRNRDGSYITPASQDVISQLKVYIPTKLEI